jgi:alcohol dehydrogenase (cytochrome c)
VWRFWTIPLPGEELAKTWIGNALEHGCGATWMTGSYDPELDLLYWAVGNPCPDFNGDERQGDNLYTASVLALRPKTGKLVWYYQFSPHDTHDWDAQEPLLLVDEVFQGQPRKLLLQANRNGFFYVLDRTNGKVLLGEPFVKQTWAKGLDENGRPIVLPNTEPTEEGVVVCPSMGGGTNWYSASYHPVTKLFYVRTTESCSLYKKNQEEFQMGQRFFGGTASGAGERKRFIRAIDPQTGNKVWDLPLSDGGRSSSGTLSTGGGLVFFGEESGALVAADAKDGNVLWKAHLNQSWWASPMTYMVGGKQYVAIAGPLGFFAFGLGE